MPLAFVDEPFSVGVAAGQFVLLMIISVPFRTLLGVTMRGLGGSVLAVAFMHTSFNRSNNTGGLADQLLSGVDHAKFGLLAMLLILGATTYHWTASAGRLDHPPPSTPDRSDDPRSDRPPCVAPWRRYDDKPTTP